MKRWLAGAAALVLACMGTTALADEAWKVIDGETKREISVHQAEDHPLIVWESPTTGLPLDRYVYLPESFLGLAVDGKYMPMLVQVDNAEGGVNGSEQWGLSYADIIYESNLNAAGGTRLSALFSDVLPDAVGPIRSARVGHVRLAAEWMGGFVHYGGQARKGSDINEEMRRKDIQIIRQKNRFDGTDGTNKPWKKYFGLREGCFSPHNKTANVAGLSTLVSDEVEQVNHTFLFTDAQPESGDEATEIQLNISKAEKYNSYYLYDRELGVYFRYMTTADGLALYVDRDTRDPLTFSNVIVQYTTVKYNGSGDAPVMATLGTGNADIFMGGRHLKGTWVHDVYHARTVFYDEEGNEIALQRGKTWISVMDMSKTVMYR